MRKGFESGSIGGIMRRFEQLGIADSRWKLVSGLVFTRGLDWSDGDGGTSRLSLMLLPSWIKIRWRAGELQPAKLYVHAYAKLTDDAR